MFNKIKKFFSKKASGDAQAFNNNYKEVKNENKNFFYGIFYNIFTKVTAITAAIVTKLYKLNENIFPSKKLSEPETEGEHYKPAIEMGLFKYEKEKIPLERGSTEEIKLSAAEIAEKNFIKESNLQNYYLYQFNKIEVIQNRKHSQVPAKNIAKIISAAHFLALKRLDIARNKGAASQLYKINVSQVNVTQNVPTPSGRSR